MHYHHQEKTAAQQHSYYLVSALWRTLHNLLACGPLQVLNNVHFTELGKNLRKHQVQAVLEKVKKY